MHHTITDNTGTPKTATVHILMCGDAGYFQHIAACLISLLDHNSGITLKVTVLVTKSGLAEDTKLRKSLADYANVTLKIVQFNPPSLANLPLATGAYPAEIYARFWVADYFDDDVERVLYLDGDMVIVGSIIPLIEVNLGENILGAVQIPGSTSPSRLGYDPIFGYFNSGVLVINLKKWRTDNVKELLIKTAYEISDKLNDPDQDVLNYCFHQKYIKLDYIWNAISPFFKEIRNLDIAETEIIRVVRDVRIVHFNGTAKPWNYLCFHPYAVEYLRCVKKTEWRNFVPVGYGFFNFFKKRAITLLGEKRAALLKLKFKKYFLKI